MFVEMNNTAKTFYNQMFDHSMNGVSLLEEAQKQFIELGFKAASTVEGMNEYVQPMKDAQAQMMDMTYTTLRTVSSQAKTMTDEMVQNVESSFASVMPKAA
jgi:ABC-type transporter MlaC component